MKLRLSRQAREDREEYSRYYGAQSPTAARHFRDELTAALRYIAAYPHGAPVRRGSVRAKRFHAYPHSILYIVGTNEIRVLAITHHKREPDHYDDRNGTE